jgi:hypothetical protein
MIFSKVSLMSAFICVELPNGFIAATFVLALYIVYIYPLKREMSQSYTLGQLQI